MPFSSGLSPQAQMLTPAQQQLILRDYAANPGDIAVPPTINFNNAGRAITGTLFAGDETKGAVGPLTKSQLKDLVATADSPEGGPLSKVAPPRQEPQVDLAEMLKKYIPEDNSQAHYLALASGLLAPTKTGTFSESMSNVATAMRQHQQEQEKTRAHYIPLIMQQVAAQQAREEQMRYRMEAQQQAQQARADAAQQTQGFQALLAQQGIIAQDARAAADRASREVIAANKLNATTGPQAEESVDKITPVLGVPVPTVFPWSNQSNARDANKVKAAEYARGAKEIEKDADAAKKLMGLAQEAQHFMELNARKDTGGITDKFTLGQAVQSLGSDYAEMQGITARLTPGMREAGSGATSDFDAKMFQRGTVGVDKPKPTNDIIAQAYIAKAKLAQDYADFRATYLEQNHTLQGADKEWNKYVSEHTIFDKAYTEVPRLNDKRVPWREYFASKIAKKVEPAAVQPVGASADVLSKADQILKGGK